MPTVLRVGPYRLFFYAGDGREPPHVHIEREDRVAKVWLRPVRLEESGGFPAHELRRILRVVENHEDDLLRRWDDYFGS